MLEELFQGAREDAAARESTVSLRAVRDLALRAPQVREFPGLAPRDGVHIIAEIKRRSPSKGDLASITDPVSLARAYERGGASVISVLTEGRRFGGSMTDLSEVSQAVGIPVLRKDFLDSEYQIVEARAAGADLVLLIMAGLSSEQATELLSCAREWGMEALVEAHSEEEVERAVSLGASLIGINARDLTTFELDTTLFSRLQHLIPDGVVKIAESAVVNSQDVTRYREQGAHAVLVGEALVTGQDPEGTVREFVAA